MARAYAAVLQALGAACTVVGRSKEGTDEFARETGFTARSGGLAALAKEGSTVARAAIIAVDASQLASVAGDAIEAGCRSLLLEKPGALSKSGLVALRERAGKAKASVSIAYNRRYLASTLKAQELLKDMGGVRSFSFEFNERVNAKESIRKFGIEKATEDNWFIGNSTHVVDLAFYLGGAPAHLEGFAASGPLWDPHPSFFSGAGITTENVPFSYRANWEQPGPWEVILGTAEGNLVLRPLESLSILKDGADEPVELDTELDTKFKPGLYRQVEAFLGGGSELPTLDEQIERFPWYEKMRGERALTL